MSFDRRRKTFVTHPLLKQGFEFRGGEVCMYVFIHVYTCVCIYINKYIYIYVHIILNQPYVGLYDMI